ncbi:MULTISPECIES: hypothetical protein [unclassified Streptomyces]|uniref:hypothetical protein n=1 Tax=unclassified Streptomyces TaxID=2593676 RepID=UPI002DDB3A6A|nr:MULTISPECIES: hypothetical protein [unclassified Streptomyces]WSA93603.1 hypothetical protein OIE63_19965 [Streptomyces sp. NBC_01795]WSB77974.1 hypothetical protein OHB04_20800 [Streptomyces sp. NBC_01775]WSS13771.1 hypothetical protein OG533_19180 [Streptomyces sp. NBC_01186]WSS42595.1 hypothetical protein OG220_19930 [Streptomyces sp. NBC_01187]
MYGWIWRHLPGNGYVRALISLVLVAGVVFLLFQYVFPWAEPMLPFNDVTVDGAAGTVGTTGASGVAGSGAGGVA